MCRWLVSGDALALAREWKSDWRRPAMALAMRRTVSGAMPVEAQREVEAQKDWRFAPDPPQDGVLESLR